MISAKLHRKYISSLHCFCHFPLSLVFPLTCLLRVSNTNVRRNGAFLLCRFAPCVHSSCQQQTANVSCFLSWEAPGVKTAEADCEAECLVLCIVTDWNLLLSGPPEYLHKADGRQVVEKISRSNLGRIWAAESIPDLANWELLARSYSIGLTIGKSKLRGCDVVCPKLCTWWYH